MRVFIGSSFSPCDTLSERPTLDWIVGRDRGRIDQIRHDPATLCANLSLLSFSLPQLNRGRVHADRPLPSAMSRPTKKPLAAARLPLSTNCPHELFGAIFVREALGRTHSPRYLEVLGKRGSLSGGTPFRGATQPKFRFQKRVKCTPQRCKTTSCVGSFLKVSKAVYTKGENSKLHRIVSQRVSTCRRSD